jgi:ferredoxin-NADP reductase
VTDDTTLTSPDLPSHVPWQDAVITGIEALTPLVKAFRLAPKLWRPFKAGQHLDVRLTAPDGYQARRSYSITSAPADTGMYELAIERLADGEVSPYFHDIAEVGDTIEVRGPFGGHFTWEAADGGPVLALGGGSGIAPIMAMARHAAALPDAPPFTSISAARRFGDAIYRNELLALEQANPSLHLLFALSREAATRAQDYSRRIDREVVDAALATLPAPPRHVFVCGSHRFVEAATTVLLSAGIPARIIRTERFGGAAAPA